jgi:hypothetical protein
LRACGRPQRTLVGGTKRGRYPPHLRDPTTLEHRGGADDGWRARRAHAQGVGPFPILRGGAAPELPTPAGRIARRPRDPGREVLAASGERRVGEVFLLHHRALALHGEGGQGRPRGRPPSPGARRPRPVDRDERQAQVKAHRPVQVAPAVELQAALRQPGDHGRGGPVAGAKAELLDGASLHEGPWPSEKPRSSQRRSARRSGRRGPLRHPGGPDARWDLRNIHVVDERTGELLAPLYPLDREANADGRRRVIDPVVPELPETAPQPGLPPLLRKLLAQYSATGLPPAYIPKPLKEEKGTSL